MVLSCSTMRLNIRPCIGACSLCTLSDVCMHNQGSIQRAQPTQLAVSNDAMLSCSLSLSCADGSQMSTSPATCATPSTRHQSSPKAKPSYPMACSVNGRYVAVVTRMLLNLFQLYHSCLLSKIGHCHVRFGQATALAHLHWLDLRHWSFMNVLSWPGGLCKHGLQLASGERLPHTKSKASCHSSGCILPFLGWLLQEAAEAPVVPPVQQRLCATSACDC